MYAEPTSECMKYHSISNVCFVRRLCTPQSCRKTHRLDYYYVLGHCRDVERRFSVRPDARTCSLRTNFGARQIAHDYWETAIHMLRWHFDYVRIARATRNECNENFNWASEEIFIYTRREWERRRAIWLAFLANARIERITSVSLFNQREAVFMAYLW